MEEIKLSTGIKKIAVKDEDGEVVTVLSINVADANTINKFVKVIDDLNNISERCKKDAAGFDDNAKDDMKQAVKVNDIRVKYLQEIVDSLDDLFGNGTIKNVFGDIIPDEMALVDFVENIVPVMNTLFGKRLEVNRKRFNPNRKGARR